MAFRKKYEYVTSLDPDLLVIQECEQKEKLAEALEATDYNEIIWIGNNPHKGIGVISYKDYQIKKMPVYNKEFEYVLPIQLSKGEKVINLFAIWAMPHKSVRSKDYVGQVWGAINYYAESLDNDSILIGDFNSNAIWNKQRKEGNHSDVVNFLQEKNIKSLYHQMNNEEHGKEKTPTIYLLKNIKKPYHLDYCFASTNLINKKTNIEIGKPKEWLKLSDHMPLIIEELELD